MNENSIKICLCIGSIAAIGILVAKDLAAQGAAGYVFGVVITYIWMRSL